MIFKEDKDLLIECADTCGIFKIDNCNLIELDYPYSFRFYSDSPHINTKLITQFNNEIWGIDKETLCYFENQFFIEGYTKDRTSCFIKPFKKKYFYMFRVEPLFNSDIKHAMYALNCYKVKLPKHFTNSSIDEEIMLKKKFIFGLCISKGDINKIQKYLEQQINNEI